jgi:imidazolonepropionase-like amidohydrolase
MVEGGMSAHEALTAATAGSARALGLDDRGTIEDGCRADLVVLNSNPLDDVAALTRPSSFRMVVKAGLVVAGEPAYRRAALAVE